MIVGNGLIARAFNNSLYEFNHVIIFASGVSNSSSTNDADFDRELSLLKKYQFSKKKLIYFRTSSLFDKACQNSPYIKHKINIEKQIQALFSRYIIYRLPILVGKSSNPYTLTNYLYNSIKLGKKIELQVNACRYLIGIDDVVKFVYQTSSVNNLIVNLNYDNKLNMVNIVAIFEKIIGVKANVVLVDKGDCYTVDNSLFISFLTKNNIVQQDCCTDVFNIIKKYYV